MITFTKQLGSHFSVYVDRITWLARDVLRKQTWSILQMMMWAIAGVLIGTLWFATLLVFVRARLDQSNTIRFARVIELQLPAELEQYALTGLFTMALIGALGAYAMFRSQRICADICIAYQKRWYQRLLTILREPQYANWIRTIEPPVESNLNRLLSESVMSIVIGSRRLLMMIQPALVLLVSAAALIAIDPVTASQLALGIPLYAIPAYLVNRHASRTQTLFSDRMPQARIKIWNAVGKMCDATIPIEERRALAEQSVGNSRNVVDEAADLFFEVRLVENRMQLVNSIALIVGLLVVLVMPFASSDAPNTDWSKILLFLIALRFAVGALSNVTGSFVLLSRFLPLYDRLISFYRQCNDQANEHAKAEGVSSRFDLHHLDHHMVVDQDHWVAILTPFMPEPLECQRLLAQLEDIGASGLLGNSAAVLNFLIPYRQYLNQFSSDSLSKGPKAIVVQHPDQLRDLKLPDEVKLRQVICVDHKGIVDIHRRRWIIKHRNDVVDALARQRLARDQASGGAGMDPMAG